MTDTPHPKTMAKILHDALGAYGLTLSHSRSLEIVAQQLGYSDWNTLSAKRDAKLRHRTNGLLMPQGWYVASHVDTNIYDIGLDPERAGVAKLTAKRADLENADSKTGVLMQSFAADAYIGERLALRAELSTRDAGCGTIWMRVDPASGSRFYLGFDNMFERKRHGVLKGTCDWTEREIVLDVPEGAGSIHLGLLLQEGGTLWGRNMSVTPVGPDVPTTGAGRFPSGPTNLGLEGPRAH